MKYGLWDQVRIDGGQEFNLASHNQKYLRDQRWNPTMDPFKSTKSTDSNLIEWSWFKVRWVKVNSWVNFPIKDAFGQFWTDGGIDTSQDLTRFTVLWVSVRVPKVGLELFIESWNHHSIDFMVQNNKTKPQTELWK